MGGETITSSGHGFIGIGRKRLLEILQDRARELGVRIEFEAECDPADPSGAITTWSSPPTVSSRFRDAYADAFGVDVDVRANKFVWLGTSKVFDALSPSRRPSTAGSGLTPIASLRTARPSSSNVRRDVAQLLASTGWTRPTRSSCSKSCSPNISTATA